MIDPQVSEQLLDEAVRAILDQPEVKGVTHHGTRVFNGWKWNRPIAEWIR